MSNKSRGLVYGNGTYLVGKYKTFESGEQTKEYRLWTHMLKRCYSNKWHQFSPTYTGCTASDNFKNFQYFAEWCSNQVGFGFDTYQLDKDVLFKGNRVYTEDTCCFLPKSLNVLITNRGNKSNKLPVGVCWDERSGKYRSTVGRGGKSKHLGHFDSIHDAFRTYKIAKEVWIKEETLKYSGLIDSRAYNKLIEWSIGIED